MKAARFSDASATTLTCRAPAAGIKAMPANLSGNAPQVRLASFSEDLSPFICSIGLFCKQRQKRPDQLANALDGAAYALGGRCQGWSLLSARLGSLPLACPWKASLYNECNQFAAACLVSAMSRSVEQLSSAAWAAGQGGASRNLGLLAPASVQGQCAKEQAKGVSASQTAAPASLPALSTSFLPPLPLFARCHGPFCCAIQPRCLRCCQRRRWRGFCWRHGMRSAFNAAAHCPLSRRPSRIGKLNEREQQRREPGFTGAISARHPAPCCAGQRARRRSRSRAAVAD